MSSTTVVNVSFFPEPDWVWIENALPSEYRMEWAHYMPIPENILEERITKPAIARYRACLQAAIRSSMPDAHVLVSHMPLITGWTELIRQRLFWRSRRTFHVAFSFNFTDLPTGVRLRLLRRAFRTVDRFVCFSSLERRLYSETFGIPIERIQQVYWGMEAPTVAEGEPPVVQGEYFAAVGGEARDYGLLMQVAASRPHLNFVIVARPHNLSGLSIPDNVRVFTNIPIEQAWNIVHYSQGSIVPLRSHTVPCGHITLVMSMYLNQPIIVTDSEGVKDYVFHEKNALLVEPGSAEALGAAVDRLAREPELGARLGANGRAFADTNCTEASTVRYFCGLLDELGLGKKQG